MTGLCWNSTEMERRKKEEAERKAKLDQIAEKQRQRERELEEKERLRREELLGRAPIPSRTEPSAMSPPVEAALAAPVAVGAAAAASSGKYVPRFKRASAGTGGEAPPPATADKWSGENRTDNRVPDGDKWGAGRKPGSAFSGTAPRSTTWSSSRARGER